MGRTLRDAILAAADAVEAAREPLCALDAVTGDGDHGLTMAIGARGVRRRLEQVEGDDPVALVRAAAAGMGSAGGAIGPIYGRSLLAVADEISLAGDPGPDGDDDDWLALLGRVAGVAAMTVAELGGAKPGDKTILDALLPFGAAIDAARADGRRLRDALSSAVEATRSGAAATAGMAARVGRSSRFGDRSVGTADPGATSFAIVVAALVETLG